MTVAATKLDAVNEILAGLQKVLPQLSIASQRSAAEKIVLNQLETYTRKGLTEKNWSFNYSEGISYTADGSGHIVLANATEMRITRLKLHKDNPAYPKGPFTLVERKDMTSGLDGGNGDGKWKGFNTIGNTFVYTVGQVVKLNLTYLRDFEETPESFRRYVTCKARLAFYETQEISGETKQWAVQELDEADADLLNDQLWRGGNSAADDVAVQQTMLENPNMRAAFGGVGLFGFGSPAGSR